MAVRTDAQEERIATLRSVMNVIALLDGEGARRGMLPDAVDLRALLTPTVEQDSEDPWFSYLARPRPAT